jgi:hypothetical protein
VSPDELAVARIARPVRGEADVTAVMSGLVRVFGSAATAPTVRLAIELWPPPGALGPTPGDRVFVK